MAADLSLSADASTGSGSLDLTAPLQPFFTQMAGFAASIAFATVSTPTQASISGLAASSSGGFITLVAPFVPPPPPVVPHNPSFVLARNQAVSWRFVLAQTPPPGTPQGTRYEMIDEITGARGKKVSLALNRSGTASFSIPVSDPLAGKIKVIETTILAVRNGRIVWSGPVLTRQASWPDGKLQVSAVGWLELLTFRELRAAKHYGATDGPSTGGIWTDADIVWDLLATVRGTEPEYAPPIYQGTAAGTRFPRQKDFAAGEKIENALRQLGEWEAGLEYSVDPLTRELNVSAWDSFADRPDVHFGYNWGPHNVGSMNMSEDGSGLRNRMTTVGDMPPLTNPVFVTDVDSKIKYGVFEETVSLAGVKDADTLGYYAAAEVALRAKPVLFYTLTPLPVGTTENVPRIFEDYFIGDRVRFSARANWHAVDKLAVRAFAADIDITDEGNEVISSLTTSLA